MTERDRTYIAIDLKSFYASVECVERSLDPLNANLVVADESRTNKTICLAVSPSLKSFGIPGRPRLFEVEQKVKQVNRERQRKAPAGILKGKSVFLDELQKDPSLALDYIVAVPRMGKYVEFSNDIYGVYLKYVSAEDIHVYSIDEVFIDVTAYLNTYRTTARELALRMIRDVMSLTGVTATAGIGSNL
ncbi:MAG: DNA methylase, partial [Erysipelotrichaceae bacterium]|nr:DNA methylase [Erysipelotrichaceae bacterium]